MQNAHRAIPPGFMTVGGLAKKMGTTVRTLQYYDNEGLLSPSAESEGGRRLYTDKDTVKLHQILSLKYLGFSLEEIKSQLVSLETTAEVAEVLATQADIIKEKIESLTEVLSAIEVLRAETLAMQTVDFEKYADIVTLLQKGNEYYWMVKHFDNDMFNHVRSKFDEESGSDFMKRFLSLSDKVTELDKSGISPDSEQGQNAAKEWWAIVTEFTGGDMSMLPQLTKLAEGIGDWDSTLSGRLIPAMVFIEAAMKIYFEKQNTNYPFAATVEGESGQ